MDVEFSSTENYPVIKTISLDGEVLDMGPGAEEIERLKDFIAATAGRDSEGNLNPIEDPLLKDVAVLVQRYATIMATMSVIADGKFTSTDTEPQYASGVVHPSYRIFTPQEAAKQALERAAKIV